MLSTIYRSARRVICWLGPADESIGDAMETLKRLAASASRFGITEVSLFYLMKAALPMQSLCSWSVSEYLVALPRLETDHNLLRPHESPGGRVQGTCSNDQLQQLEHFLRKSILHPFVDHSRNCTVPKSRADGQTMVNNIRRVRDGNCRIE